MLRAVSAYEVYFGKQRLTDLPCSFLELADRIRTSTAGPCCGGVLIGWRRQLAAEFVPLAEFVLELNPRDKRQPVHFGVDDELLIVLCAREAGDPHETYV